MAPRKLPPIVSGNSAPDVDAGVNAAPHLGGQCCGDHDGRGESTNYRKLAEHI